MTASIGMFRAIQERVYYLYREKKQFLELAGGSRSILQGSALSAVYGYSEGNAGKIDNLMTDALRIGAQQQKPCISAEMIMAGKIK